jgi:hypothetical protein
MIDRRERQLARTPGFTPVSQARADTAISSAMALIMAASANEAGVPTISQEQAYRMAVRQILPPPQRSKLLSIKNQIVKAALRERERLAKFTIEAPEALAA